MEVLRLITEPAFKSSSMIRTTGVADSSSSQQKLGAWVSNNTPCVVKAFLKLLSTITVIFNHLEFRLPNHESQLKVVNLDSFKRFYQGT